MNFFKYFLIINISVNLSCCAALNTQVAEQNSSFSLSKVPLSFKKAKELYGEKSLQEKEQYFSEQVSNLIQSEPYSPKLNLNIGDIDEEVSEEEAIELQWEKIYYPMKFRCREIPAHIKDFINLDLNEMIENINSEINQISEQRKEAVTLLEYLEIKKENREKARTVLEEEKEKLEQILEAEPEELGDNSSHPDRGRTEELIAIREKIINYEKIQNSNIEAAQERELKREAKKTRNDCGRKVVI